MTKASTVTFERDSIINTIRNNLDPKRYGDRFSITQEFIQNADDAKAERLIIGYGRLPDEKQRMLHPLLGDDGVFFVNDGILTQDDRKHIFTVATSNKGSDKNKIGNFGLGMKSAFHVCESFFLFFDQPENQKELGEDADFLDPWYDEDENETPQIRRDWHDKFNANGEAISHAVKNYLLPWVKDWPRWFCVWLPLRKPWMYDESYEPILKVCWDKKEVDKLFSLKLSPVIAEMLPFLKKLREVTLLDATSNAIMNRISVLSERRLSLENGNLDMRIDHSSEALSAINVIGSEKLYKSEKKSEPNKFETMMQAPDFPRISTRDKNGVSLKSKVIPHTAVFWARSEVEHGTASHLIVKHCVFLPLTDEKQKTPIQTGLPFDLTFCLHAELIIDAGRQDFSTSAAPDAPIEKRWNHLLISEGLLPMVIPSLEREIATWNEENKIEHITEAVKAFNEFLDKHDEKISELNYRELITQKHQFLNCLTADGWKWQRHPASKKFFSIPLTYDADLQSVLFQKLAIEDLVLTPLETKGITSASSVKMDDAIFRRLRIAIDNLPPKKRYTTLFIKWLSDLIKEYPMDASKQRELLAVFLDKIEKQNYWEHHNEIYELMTRFSEVTQKISLAKTNWDEDTFSLWKKTALQKGIQIIPMPFYYSDSSSDKWPELGNEIGENITVSEHEAIPVGDLEILFQFIDGKMTKAAEDEKRRALFRSIIFTYLKRCPEANQNETICGIGLFPFKDQNGEWVFLSLDEIRDKTQHIFLSGGPYLKTIENAAYIRYFILYDDDFKSLMTDYGLTTFSRNDISRFFQPGNPPALKPVASRVELFKSLLDSDNLRDYIDIIRYLLLGDPACFTIREDLYILPHENNLENKAKEFWDEMLKVFFEKTNKQQKKLPSELTSKIRREQETLLKIHSLTPDTILRNLKDVEIGKVLPFDVNSRTWQHLVKNFTDSDRTCCQVAMSLPVFPIQNDRFSSLDETVYFNNGKCRVPDLALDVIKRCEIPFEKVEQLYETTGKEKPLWSYQKTLEFCANRKKDFPAEKLAPLIKEALGEIIKEGTELDESMVSFLRNQQFLLGKKGEYVCPSQILNLPDLPENLQEVIHDSGLYLYEDIQIDKFDKRAWGWCEDHLLPAEDEYPARLGSALASQNEYCLGALPKSNGVVSDNVAVLFKGNAVAQEIFPAIGFVERLLSALPEQKRNNFVWPAFLAPLAGEIPSERMLEICNQLLKRESKRPSGLYLLYLKTLVNTPDFSNDILSKLKLPNGLGEICRASELVHSGKNMSEEQVLHKECAKILLQGQQRQGEKIAEPKSKLEEEPKEELEKKQFDKSHNLEYDDWKKKVSEARSLIESYFNGWGDDFNYHIATLVNLCDDSTEMQNYVKQHLWDNGDVKNMRRKIQLPELTFADKKTFFDDYYKGCRLFLDVNDGKSMTMQNLLGEPIDVKMGELSEMKSLLVGDDCYSCVYVHRPGKSVYLSLRLLSAAERQLLGVQKLMELLEETIRVLMEKMTGYRSAADGILEEIKHTELLDLEIIREVILDGLHSYLPSLGIKKSSLSVILGEWHDLNKQLIQAKQNPNSQERVKELEESIQAKKKELREAVETDKQAQNDILHAVITRITEHCGYDFDSIPFELFQNADDAAQEMMEFADDGNPSRYRNMVIRLSKNALTVLHFGRPINKQISKRDDDENAHGFQDDLEKMLLLWRSDKEIGELKRTGKFGLGFKSVYQLTDAPLIASNHRRFRIMGTLFPISADENERSFLEKEISDMKMEGGMPTGLPTETLIHLSIREGIEVQSYGEKRMDEQATMCLRPFIDSADLLVIFSHAIKTLTIIDTGGKWSVGYHQQDVKNGVELVNTRDGHDYGVIRLRQSGIDIVLGYDCEHDRFKRLDESIATIWITEPTKEHNNLGFAVNGDFAVDIGRNSLMATNKHNETLANDANEELYIFLKTQYDASPFSPEWLASLWECFTGGEKRGQWKVRNQSGVGTYLPNIIWGTRGNLRGYGKFLEKHPGVPTKLAGVKNAFLRLGDCKYYCEQELMDGDNWKLFEPFSHNQLDATVSYPTYEALSFILNWQLEEITGAGILKDWLKSHNSLSTDYLNGRQWSKILRYCENRGYLKEIMALVSKCRFLNKKNIFVPAQKLISEKIANNEEYKALLAFADDASILSDEYDEQARNLFAVACSHEQHISVDDMVNWALNAAENEVIEAICRYLVIGNYSYELAKRLEREKSLNPDIEKAVKMRLGTSIPGPGDNGTSAGREVSTQETTSQLEDLQERGIIIDEADALGEGPEKTRSSLSEDDLDWLRDNWSRYKEDIVSKYNEENYGEKTIRLKYPLELGNDSSARQRWMELFILAMCRRIGRQQDVQHFGFIQKCRSLGWLTIFAAPNESIETKSQKWIGLLDSCFDKSGTPEMYSHWMQLFPWIYQCNKYLDKYVSLFEKVNRRSFTPQTVDDIFNPSESPIWTTGNMRVPPLKYALGHLGPHWIIRELVRSGTLTNPKLYPFCFVPSTAVKRLFGRDDITSQEIYEKLKGETFDLQFDIAFKTLDKEC